MREYNEISLSNIKKLCKTMRTNATIGQPSDLSNEGRLSDLVLDVLSIRDIEIEEVEKRIERMEEDIMMSRRPRGMLDRKGDAKKNS